MTRAPDCTDGEAPPAAQVVQDIGFISYPNAWVSDGIHFQRDCENSLGQTEDVSFDLDDLNQGTDFIGDDDSIMLCWWKPFHPVDSSNPYVFGPAGVKSSEDLDDPEGTKVRYAVTAYDREGTALTPQCSPGASDGHGPYTLVAHGQTSASVTCTATDDGGRTQTATFGITVTPAEPQLVPPTITAEAVSGGQPYTGAWTRDNVTVTFTCRDGGGALLDSVTPPVTFSHNAFGGVAGGSCTDGSGHSVFTQFGPVNIDKIAPTVTGRVNGLTAPAWFNRPFEIVWQGQDALSGIRLCETTSYAGPDTAAAIRSGHCVDRAGNEGTGSFTFAYDHTPPVVTGHRTPDKNANGWNNTDIGVWAEGSDGLSGIASCTNLVLSKEGQNQTATVSCRDVAGNVRPVTINGINIDKTPPAVEAVPDRAADRDGWYGQPFTVGWRGSDSLSGVVGGCSAAETYAGPDTAAGELTGACEDLAGNRAVGSFAFRYDVSPPETAFTSTFKSPVNSGSASFAFAGTDEGIGISRLEYRLDNGPFGHCIRPQAYSGLSDGTHVFAVRAVDGFGNADPTPATFSWVIDTTPPAVTLDPASDGCSLPGNGGWCRGIQTAGFTASDLTGVVGPCVGTTCAFMRSTATNGPAVPIASGPVCDGLGNCTPGINAGPYAIDSVPPRSRLRSRPIPSSWAPWPPPTPTLLMRSRAWRPRSADAGHQPGRPAHDRLRRRRRGRQRFERVGRLLGALRVRRLLLADRQPAGHQQCEGGSRGGGPVQPRRRSGARRARFW